MKFKLLHVLSFIIVTSLSCSEDEHIAPASINYDLENAFTLGYLQTGTEEASGLSVQFIELVEDTRCPNGVECVSAGWVIIRIKIADSITLTLGTDSPDSESITFNNYKITLIDVTPYPEYDQTYTNEDYQIQLLIEEI